MSIPVSPRTIVPTTGRRHFGENAIAKREEQELLRYQAQLESSSRALTPQLGASIGMGGSVSGTAYNNRTTIPNSIIAHYTDDSSPQERADKRKAAAALTAHEEAIAREVQSKLFEEKIRQEQLKQMEVQKQIKEEEALRERELEAMVLREAHEAVKQAKHASHQRQQRARDISGTQIQLAEDQRINKILNAKEERSVDKQESDLLAMQFKQETQLKKDFQKQVALADQRLWDHQKALQAVQNSPTKSLSPRDNLRRHVESDTTVISEHEQYQRLLDLRALEHQRQQEEKVQKQLSLINAGTEGTIKMSTPRQQARARDIDALGSSVGMVERLDETERSRVARSEALKRGDASHQLETVKNSTPRKVVQNGLYSWSTASALQTSSPRTDGAAKTFEQAPTMIEKLAGDADMDAIRRKEEGRHIESIQKMQADQRRLVAENEKGAEVLARVQLEAERRAKEEALNKHIEAMLSSNGVAVGSPKASRLMPDSPRRAPGPGAYGNFESGASSLRK